MHRIFLCGIRDVGQAVPVLGVETDCRHSMSPVKQACKLFSLSPAHCLNSLPYLIWQGLNVFDVNVSIMASQVEGNRFLPQMPSQNHAIQTNILVDIFQG